MLTGDRTPEPRAVAAGISDTTRCMRAASPDIVARWRRFAQTQARHQWQGQVRLSGRWHQRRNRAHPRRYRHRHGSQGFATPPSGRRHRANKNDDPTTSPRAIHLALTTASSGRTSCLPWASRSLAVAGAGCLRHRPTCGWPSSPTWAWPSSPIFERHARMAMRRYLTLRRAVKSVTLNCISGNRPFTGGSPPEFSSSGLSLQHIVAPLAVAFPDATAPRHCCAHFCVPDHFECSS